MGTCAACCAGAPVRHSSNSHTWSVKPSSLMLCCSSFKCSLFSARRVSYPPARISCALCRLASSKEACCFKWCRACTASGIFCMHSCQSSAKEKDCPGEVKSGHLGSGTQGMH